MSGPTGRVAQAFIAIRRGLDLAWNASPRLLMLTLVLQLITGLGTVGLVVLVSKLAARLVDIPDQGIDGMSTSFIAFLVLSLVTLGAATIKGEYSALLSERAELHATDTVLDAAAQATLVEYESPEFHDLMSRSLEAAVEQPATVVPALLGLASSTVALLGLGVALISVSPWLLIVVALGAGPLWWTYRKGALLGYNFVVDQTERDRQHGYLTDTLSSRTSAAELRLYGIGHELRGRARRLHQLRIDDLGPVVRQRVLLGLLGVLIATGLGAIVLVVLARSLDDGSLEVDQAALAMAAFLVLSERLQAMASSAASVLQCSLFLGDLELFTRRRSTGDAATESVEIESVVLDDVSFCYPASDTSAVHGVSLELVRGELVAMVGQNGSGKTTLAKLVTQLYQPTTGVALVNGRSVDEMNVDVVRRRIAMVHQDHLSLLMSAADNIGLGDITNPDDRARVELAAHQAQIHDAIAAMPNGFDTVLGTEFSGGLELSGGQWQRLAIARAWFRNADVLVLDEPTSSLDPEAELELIQAVRELAEEKAVLLISHRFGTVSSADRVIVMDGGGIAEQGSHDELMQQRGIYAAMYRTQAEPFQDKVVE